MRARIRELDGLRALAIIAVMVHHCWPREYPLSGLADAGWMGVDLFFVLSGYLITGILLRTAGQENYYVSFVRRRALRIFPLYYLCLALFTAVAVLRPDQASWSAMKSWGGAGWFVVYLGNFRAAWMHSLPPVLSFAALWSLQVEEQFYLLFPIAVGLLSIRNLWRFLIACILIAPVLRSLASNAVASYVLMPCRMDALAMGGIVAILFSRDLSLPLAARARLTFFASSAVVLGIAWTGPPAWMSSAGYSAVDFACASLLCWILGSPGGRLAWLLRMRPLVYTGRIAYGLYILHEPASWIARRIVGNALGMTIETHSVLSVPITFAASFLVAAISWRFFEAPILAWKNRGHEKIGLCPSTTIASRRLKSKSSVWASSEDALP